MDGKRQKTQMEMAFAEDTRDEVPTAKARAEPPTTRRDNESQALEQRLMEEICTCDNIGRAIKHVMQNKGAPGVDGMPVRKLPAHFAKNGQRIIEELLNGIYKPMPVKRSEVPKDGGGRRKLGIPTATDRTIQQAVLQVIQPSWDVTFSDSSYGFRPGRSAHQAIAKAQQYIAEERGWVVDIDLERFFDRVNHDRLMARLAKRIDDKRLLKLIRAFLNSGVMEEGLITPTGEGTPQGGPLSPLLSNIVLDELDRELERRGHKFVRYADDCNIYMRSERAAKRVMENISRFITKKLKLKVNEAKSAASQAWERKFLGFTVTKPKEGKPAKRIIAPRSIRRLKQRVRKITCPKRGKNKEQMTEELARYLPGWRAYFGYCEVPSQLERLDGWIRRRLRAAIWRRWETFKRRSKELHKRGVNLNLARGAAASRKGPWRLSTSQALHIALPNPYFKKLGLPLLAPV